MRVGMIDTQAIRQRWESVGSKLDERGRRVFAAGGVRSAGWGGPEAVLVITGLARSTVGRGLKDLDAAPLPKAESAARVAAGGICRAGRGRRVFAGITRPCHPHRHSPRWRHGNFPLVNGR
jgi:hypothetical protein